MTVWDLSRLRYTIRKITGRFDESQLPNTSSGSVSINDPPGIDDYINDFYLLDFPEHLRSLRIKDWLTFTTLPNCGTYFVPQNYYQIEPPLYIDNYQFSYYQSPDIFYRVWPELNFIEQNLFTPDGVNATYKFKLSQTPIQQGTVVIGLQPNIDANPSPQLETFTDLDSIVYLDQPPTQRFVNPGALFGNLGGAGFIDYLTGFCTITYDTTLPHTVPPVGTKSSVHYHPYVASRPRDVLFFNQKLFIRPIPNDTYSVKVMAYLQPTVAMANSNIAKAQFDGITTDSPLFNEWWEMIAYGASLKILIEEGDHEEYDRNKGYFEEAKLLAQRRCLKQLANQRMQTPYAGAGNYQGPAWPIFPLF